MNAWAGVLPHNKEAIRDLLELKNIALLYELWTFFRIVHELAVLESPPVRSERRTSSPFQTDFAAGGTFQWASGVRLVYNQCGLYQASMYRKTARLASPCVRNDHRG